VRISSSFTIGTNGGDGFPYRTRLRLDTGDLIPIFNGTSVPGTANIGTRLSRYLKNWSLSLTLSMGASTTTTATAAVNYIRLRRRNYAVIPTNDTDTAGATTLAIATGPTPGLVDPALDTSAAPVSLALNSVTTFYMACTEAGLTGVQAPAVAGGVAGNIHALLGPEHVLDICLAGAGNVLVTAHLLITGEPVSPL
jgi:hypothetical protein